MSFRQFFGWLIASIIIIGAVFLLVVALIGSIWLNHDRDHASCAQFAHEWPSEGLPARCYKGAK